MKHSIYSLLMVFCSIQLLSCQNVTTDQSILFHINDNIKNSEEEYFIEIFNNWRTYLNSNQFVRSENEFWNQEEYNFPDFGYVSLLMDIRHALNEERNIQCSIIGIVPAKNDFYHIKSVFTEKQDSSEMVNINFIVSVFAKQINDRYEFYSSTEYFKQLYKNEKYGSINYIVHPEHGFDEEAANRMQISNIEIANQFESPPLQFDYVVANDTRDLGDILGVHLFEYSFQPVASGGMADTYNNVIYAGNNSEYYPHEVVHLYTHAKYARQYHPWVDEGIAALLGGSTGYDIEWHWEKLRRFIEENPDYNMDDLTALQTQIPNGEFMTDFRYPIGALICQRIIDKEGMKGIFEALQAGRSEDDYFNMLKDKLNIKRAEFGNYVKEEMLKMEPIKDDKMESYKY